MGKGLHEATEANFAWHDVIHYLMLEVRAREHELLSKKLQLPQRLRGLAPPLMQATADWNFWLLTISLISRCFRALTTCSKADSACNHAPVPARRGAGTAHSMSRPSSFDVEAVWLAVSPLSSVR